MNVRELQGALNKLAAHQALGAFLQAADVRAVLGAPAAAPPPPPRQSGAEFFNFLSDVASAVAQHVESWKMRLGEALAYWSGEGYRTALLERAMAIRG